MSSALEYCQPRQDIVAGSFNPEVFTASLSPIVEYYQGGKTQLDSIYTNAELFFKDATYPTQGLKIALAEVFSRIAGDATVPAIHRLETTFGGGKTHTLIACAHIAKQGNILSQHLSSFLDEAILPEPNSVHLVGIAGEEIPVHKPKGTDLVPYTLWGEMAYQVGGEELYREVEEEAGSYAAPGKNYFEKVLGGNKVLIMLDELAQYAARLEAARVDGSSQLAAFLMGLHAYARNRTGIAIVLTLASTTDAFSNQTSRLAELIRQVRGDDTTEGDAIGIGERALKGVASVVARDAVQLTPVQARELSSVLSKRLFSSIDRDGSRKTVDKYLDMYRRNSTSLPEEASRDDYADRMLSNYPFHPTLVDFLNLKLTNAENFQGTRGVLRVLSLAVRRIWQQKQPVPMIHVCHLDFKSDRVTNEVLGRTNSSDLHFILNADVGGVDTGNIEGGRSNAEIADKLNPHPAGLPYHEYTWKTVFLHSLVGREEGLQSKIFGITVPEALFAVASPDLTPPQVNIALEEIKNSAFYLRCDEGKYYADKSPTINHILARIRKTLTAKDIENILRDASRKIIKQGAGSFLVEHDVQIPEDIPDGKNRPVIGVISLNAEDLDVKAMITTKGPHLVREQQNLVILLAPKSVPLALDGHEEQSNLFPESDTQLNLATADRQRLEGLARQVRAMQILIDKPLNYGVKPSRLEEADFRENKATTENDLMTSIAGQYSNLYFSSTGGEIVHRTIRTGGGEGGAPFYQLIRDMLIQEGKLLSASNTAQSDLMTLSKLFFAQQDNISFKKLQQNFGCLRSWPILEEPGVLEQVVRAGVEKGAWCLYRISDEESTRPDEFYGSSTGIPMGINLNEAGYSLITPQGANQRGWSVSDKPDPAKIKDGVTKYLHETGLTTLEQVLEKANEEYGDIALEVASAVSDLVKQNRLYAIQQMPPNEQEKPALIKGDQAMLYSPKPTDHLITPAQAAERSWVEQQKQGYFLTGKKGAQIFLSLVGRLGSLYNRGAKSRIDALDIVGLQLKGGGQIRVELTDLSADAIKELDEFFDSFSGVADKNEDSEVYLEIRDPVDDCLLIKELQNLEQKDAEDNDS